MCDRLQCDLQQPNDVMMQGVFSWGDCQTKPGHAIGSNVCVSSSNETLVGYDCRYFPPVKVSLSDFGP